MIVCRAAPPPRSRGNRWRSWPSKKNPFWKSLQRGPRLQTLRSKESVTAEAPEPAFLTAPRAQFSPPEERLRGSLEDLSRREREGEKGESRGKWGLNVDSETPAAEKNRLRVGKAISHRRCCALCLRTAMTARRSWQSEHPASLSAPGSPSQAGEHECDSEALSSEPAGVQKARLGEQKCPERPHLCGTRCLYGSGEREMYSPGALSQSMGV